MAFVQTNKIQGFVVPVPLNTQNSHKSWYWKTPGV